MLLNSKTLFEAESLAHDVMDIDALRLTDVHSLTAQSARPRPLQAHHVLDKILAAVAIVFFAPLFLLIAALIKMHDGGTVVFRHRRVGEGGRMFECYKFRSMVLDSESALKRHLEANPTARAEWSMNHKLHDDPRITGLGKFLRKTSLDELPQFFNVLQGEMSLVGPRPIVREELLKYGRFARHYLRTRPGITGLWQISGRNDVSYRKRIALDILFIRKFDLVMYLKILALTVPAVLLRKGSY